jgi:hypothetical protein
MTCAFCDTDSSTVWHRIGGKDYCPSCVFVCEGHGELLPASERSDCDHFALCTGCADEDYCIECARADAFYDEVDRAYAAHKDGD